MELVLSLIGNVSRLYCAVRGLFIGYLFDLLVYVACVRSYWQV